MNTAPLPTLSLLSGGAAALNLLSGGAAQGLVSALQAQFQAAGGPPIEGTFGAVGAMQDKLLAGTPCDVVILSEALVTQLIASGHVASGSAWALGRVSTGLAVQAGTPLPKVGTAAELKAALRAAGGIYFPDPVKATAGIHFFKVLRELDLADALAGRLHTFPNGANAMREMAASADRTVIGCTQVTEILVTPGAQWVAPLPPGCELATVYTAAVCSGARQPEAAARLVGLLSGPDSAAQRRAAGFD